MESSGQSAGDRATRRRRLQLAALGLLAVVIVVVAVLAFGSGESDEGSKLNGTKEVAAQLRGIPQEGNTLGDRDAPVTLVEFSDPQCPFCRDYHQGRFPEILERYVRPGRVVMIFQPMTFIGRDSVSLGLTMAAASRHNRMWNVIGLAYANQGRENSGWATGQLVTDILEESGLDSSEVTKQAGERASRRVLALASNQARTFGIDSTPSFLVGRTGGQIERRVLTSTQVTRALDRLLKR